MASLKAQTRKRMLDHYETHSTQETANEFNVTKQTVLKWYGRYDGTLESLEDAPRSSAVYSSLEIKTVQISLVKHNAPNRKRNVLEPTYYEVYQQDGRFRRSRSSLRKLANRLLGKRTQLCRRHQPVVKREHHLPSRPGDIQIDMKVVPTGCVVPEDAEKVKAVMRQNAIRECNRTLCRLYEEIAKEPAVEPLLRYLCKETIDQYIIFREELDRMDDLSQRFYQYTAVDECSRWPFRMLFDTQNEQSALRFLHELILVAPFKIRRVTTDNGSEFTSKYLMNHDGRDTLFEIRLRIEGIQYARIKPGKPWQNGKVESQHRLDQERFYDNLQMNDLEDGRRQLAVYDEASRHFSKQCLKGRSPMEVLIELEPV